MSAILTIVTTEDILNYATGRANAERRMIVEEALASDPRAKAALAAANTVERWDRRSRTPASIEPTRQQRRLTMTSVILNVKPEVEHPDTGIDNRKRLAGNLGGVLADTYLLLVKTQGYHWNVVGPLFVSIHGLTEEHYQDLFAAADDLAERIRALGYPAPTSVHEMVKVTLISEDDGNPTAEEMVLRLVRDHETIVRRLRDTTELAEELRDQVTADMLTARMQVHEKAIWMLKAIVAA